MTTQDTRKEGTLNAASPEVALRRRPLQWPELLGAGTTRLTESGKIGYAILWLLGVPLPLLIIIYLIWGR